MAKYKREFKLFIMGKIEIPPKKPPWMRDRNADRGSGIGDYMKDSDDELSISDNESLGSVASTDRGPPPSVPSWARSKGSSKDKEKVPTKAESVRSRSTGGGTVTELKRTPKASEPVRDPLLAVITELLAKVVEKGTDTRSGGGGYRPKLTSIICNKWSGDRKLKAKDYRVWKKHIQGIAMHNQLSDQDQAFLISLNVTGQAQVALDIFENEDFADAKIFDKIWSTLDEQHEQLAHVRIDEAYKAWETAHRKHGESMNTWIINLKKIKLELDAQDIECVISRRMYASKLMRGSGLPSDKRIQVLFHAGGVYDPEKLSTVLRLSHGDIQDHDERKGKAYPLKLRVKKTYKTVKKRYRSTNYQDQDEDDEAPDEEEEGDADVMVEDVEGDEEEESDEDEEDEDDTNDTNAQDYETDDTMSVDTDTAENHFSTIKDAFMAGWKSKTKVNEKRKARGFTDPSNGGGKGQGKKKSFKKKTTVRKEQVTIKPASLRKSSGSSGKKPQVY